MSEYPRPSMAGDDGGPEAPPSRAYQELADAYREVFLETETGLRILADLRHNFGYDAEPMYIEGHAPDTAVFRAGQRLVLAHINRMLTNPNPKQPEIEY